MSQVIAADLKSQRDIDDEIANCEDEATIRVLYTCRNTFAVICRLPTELMVQIFTECKAPLPGGYDYDFASTRLQIMLVCTLWRAIVVATPQLWTFVSTRQRQWIGLSLQRAQTMPLTVECAEIYRREDVILLKRLIQEMHRFKELRIHWEMLDTFDLTAGILDNSSRLHSPLLQTLVIDVSFDTMEHWSLNDELSVKPAVFEGFWSGFTALRSMELHNALPIHTAPLLNLTHLTIRVAPKGNCLSIPWVVECLRNTPLLEELKIGTISSKHPLIIPPLPIPLPNLRSISLKLQSVKESKLFLHLERPSSPPPFVVIDFEYGFTHRYTNEQEDHIFSCLQQLISKFTENVENLSSSLLEVTLNLGSSIAPSYCLTVKAAENKSHPYYFFLHILSKPSSLRGQTVHLTSAFPLERICKLSLKGHMRKDEVIAWRKLLPRLVELKYISVESITILTRLAGLGLFSRAPKRRISSADFNNRKLQEICVKDDKSSTTGDWSTFVRICKTRAEHGMPIETVQIQSCNVQEGHVRQLEQYTDIYWDEDKEWSPLEGWMDN